MGGGNGIAVPRLSKRFNERMKSMEPSQEQLKDVSGNPYQGKEKYPIAQLSFSSQTHCPHHVNLLSTELLNPMPLCVIPAGTLPERVGLPLMRDDPGKESSYPQSDIATGNAEWFPRPFMEQHMSYSSSGLSPVSKTSAANTEAASNFQLALCPVEHDERLEHVIASMIGYSSNRELADVLEVGEKVPAQDLLYSKQISDGDRFDVDEPHSRALIPSIEVNARNVRERIRKAKISEGIKALKSSVPCSGTSDKDDDDSVLDDAIDYIKYLKLQLKLLSQNRLSGESATYPFVHIEGYGHYFLQQMVHNDPLEDVMGNLLEMNPQAANKLLESKGLTTMPMDFAYTLLQTN